MTPFAGLILGLILAVTVPSVAVGVARERMRWAFRTRTKRVGLAVLLLVVEAIVALILSSIDFGLALKGPSFTPDDQPLLKWLLGLTAVGAALQTSVLLHDDYAEEERGVLQKEAELAKKDRAFVTLLSNVINKAVARKREKLIEVKENDAVALLGALDPKLAIAALIQGSWHVFDQMGPEKRVGNFRLRVAYYRIVGGNRLTLAHAWNGTDQDCVTLSDDVRKRFRFDHPSGCLAVAASRSGGMLLVPDTVAAHDDRHQHFWFFEEPEERETLKSIAALPIKLDGTRGPYSVLVVDTNEKDFFNGEPRQRLELEQVVKNLAQRLQLEERLGVLIGEPQ